MSRCGTVAGLVVLLAAGAAKAPPPVQPPPAKELRDGNWQVRAEPADDGRKAYWFAAGMSLAFGAGLGSMVTGRLIGRGRPAGRVGAGIGAAVGTAVVLALGRPEGTPAVVGPTMVGVYALVGAVAGWHAARERPR